MSKHTPIVEEAYRSWDCIYGECDHDDEADCMFKMVACEGCRDEAPADEETELVPLTEWPCALATHYGEPATSELKAKLLEGS
jgi:hypothetical protein